MLRLLVYLVIVAALGFGFAWFADRPGEVRLTWQGTQYETSLIVVLSAVVALVAAILLTWWLLSAVIRSPGLVNRFFKNRRRDKGYNALSRGLIAAGYGDGGQARQLARESRKLLGAEPLVELLDAQTALLEGDRAAARDRFETMLDQDETRLVALRGLYLEAEREGETAAARHYAEQAAEEAPGLAWAGNAMLKFQAMAGDWEAALKTLENMRASGRLPKEEAARKRAVLLTALAFDEEQANPEQAAKHAKEAHRLAPDLVPAAIAGSTALVRLGDLRRSAKMLETVWKKSPHPEIADAYVHLRSGDSVLDRLKRARKLAGMRAGDRESAMAVAEAAIGAGQWAEARKVMAPILEKDPTERACLIMADLEESEYGDRGRMRAWLSRAVRARQDPTWVADGYTSDHWLPASPVTGEVDAFEWKVPLAALDGPRDMPDVEALVEPLAEPAPQSEASPIPVGVPEALAASAATGAAASTAAMAATDGKPAEESDDPASKPDAPKDAGADDAAGRTEEAAPAQRPEPVVAETAGTDSGDADGQADDAEAAAPRSETDTSDATERAGKDDESEGAKTTRLDEGTEPAPTAIEGEILPAPTTTSEDGGETTGAPAESDMAGAKGETETQPAEKRAADREQSDEDEIFPFGRPPDDPGVDPAEKAEEEKRFRLF